MGCLRPNTPDPYWKDNDLQRSRTRTWIWITKICGLGVEEQSVRAVCALP